MLAINHSVMGIAQPSRRWTHAWALLLLACCGLSAQGARAQAVSISDGQATYTPGHWVTYTVTVTNNTGASIAASSRRLRVPAVAGQSISDIACTGSGATCPVIDQTTQVGQITLLENTGTGLVLPSMPIGSSLTFQVAGAFHANASGSITKTASVTNGTGSTVITSASDSTSAINVPVFVGCPSGAQYHTWTGSGFNHTGSMTPPAGFTGLPNVTSATVNSTGIVIGSAESLAATLGTDSMWPTMFGASPAGNPMLRTALNNSPAGFTSPAVQTLNFASPVAANSWGFLFGDVDVEQVRIEAFSGPNLTGTAYSAAQINGWYRGVYDQDALDGRDLPRWIPSTGWAVGANLFTSLTNPIPPATNYLTDQDIGVQSSRPAIWFTPGAPVQSMRITYQNLGSGATVRLYMAGCLQPRPQLRLQKALPAGRVNAGDQFALSIAGTGAGAGAAVTTTGTGSAVTSAAALVNPATAGSTYTFAEAAAGTTTLGSYATTYSCSNTLSGGQTPSGDGTTFNVTPVAGDNLTCTFSNEAKARLTIVKSVPAGQGTAFDFSQSGMPVTATGTPNAATATAFTLNPSVVSGSNLTATQIYTNVTPGVAITVNELKTNNINQYSLVNINCANAAGTPTGSTFPTSINNGAAAGSPIGTATVTLVAGADVTCTYNNVRNPRIVIVKNTVGGDGTFTFTEASSAAGTSLSPASPINLVTSGGSATVNTTIAGLSGTATTNVTITEAVTTGFTLSSVNCTNLTAGTALTTGTTPSATVTLASRQVVLGGVGTGSEVQCTFVNTSNAQLVLRKTWVNAQLNNAVNIPATSGFATNTTAFTSVANTANETDSSTAVGVLVGATGTLPTETFTTGSQANYLTTGWVCTDGGSTLNVAQGGSLTIPASSAGTTLVCTLTNTRRQATLALAKVWSNAVVNDTATLQSSGGVNNATLASVVNNANETDTGTAVNVFAGEVFTLSETLGASNAGVYSASAWTCTGTSGLSGSTLTIGGADAAMVCSITNTRSSADLTITKASTSSPVTSGGTITYNIVVTNNGPSAANNAVVIDDWTTQSGLDCSASAVPPGTATCAVSGTAGTQCPAPASVTPAGLQAGLAIPALPNGGIVTFTLQCAVTATGQ